MATGTDKIKLLVPDQISGLTFGFMNFTLVLIGALSQPVFGYLLEWFHPGSTHLSVFGGDDFGRAFLLMPILYAVALLCALFSSSKVVVLND